ncbi:MAG: Na+/H+ antiporter NhaA [bacterium]|nr:sodium:proton antiporter [Planctomycetota bacterium]HIL51634.1 sodium:proton antiporter [Planctomycetota bacterium]
MSSSSKGFVNFLQEFSIPLIVGVFAALVAANLFPGPYHHWFGEIHGTGAHGTGHDEVFNFGFALFGHTVGLHFLVNDIFMVFFFGIAAKEIAEAALPGGSLNPLKNAINPLLATLGGVVGPVAVFFLALLAWHGANPGAFPEGATVWGDDSLSKGWGIPTATDIALAWLVARAVFGKGHPAIGFLLLLAVADDAIGLGIIAIFYGDPANPAAPEFLGLVAVGMAIAALLRRRDVQSWIPYIALGGTISWVGLMLAHLHPALALVPIVPFLPGPETDTGLFIEDDEVDRAEEAGSAHGEHHSPLHQFEHQLKFFVDFGLFFFAFANAGVELAGIGPMTWIILLALVVGKTVGVTAFGLLGIKMGFKLPGGMGIKELVMAGFIAALGLTVALFVAGAAFIDPVLQGQAKMGALFSGFVGLAAILLGRALGLGQGSKADSKGDQASEAA